MCSQFSLSFLSSFFKRGIISFSRHMRSPTRSTYTNAIDVTVAMGVVLCTYVVNLSHGVRTSKKLALITSEYPASTHCTQNTGIMHIMMPGLVGFAVSCVRAHFCLHLQKREPAWRLAEAYSYFLSSYVGHSATFTLSGATHELLWGEMADSRPLVAPLLPGHEQEDTLKLGQYIGPF